MDSSPLAPTDYPANPCLDSGQSLNQTDFEILLGAETETVKKALLAFGVFCLVSSLHAREPIRLASAPALSPDGKTLAFGWRGQLWRVASTGGVAQPLTVSGVGDGQPSYSRDGTKLAFVSARAGSPQVYVMNLTDGSWRQVTYHSEGSSLQGWYPDGRSLLLQASRDSAWRYGERFYQVEIESRAGEKMLFDTAGGEGQVSPDGKKLLFVREGVPWWLKGYKGSRAGQIWLYEFETQKFTQLVAHPSGAGRPIWRADSQGFYYVDRRNGVYQIRQRDLTGGNDRTVGEALPDAVDALCLSADGSTLVYRYRFDFYRLVVAEGKPQRIDIVCETPIDVDPIQRRVLQSAREVAFSDDGLEMALVAGGDVWVMDTELRRPRRVTRTPGEESSPVFSPDGKQLLFVSETDGQCDVWKATRGDAKKYWWQNDQFVLERLTTDGESKSHVRFSPNGKLMAFARGRGDLWVMRPDGKDARRLMPGVTRPEFDWSPDGKWIACAVYDADFNRDIWIVSVDGVREPFNVSRHPTNDSEPRWSPDGKMLAFVGQRGVNETGLFYVFLTRQADDLDAVDRATARALEKMQKAHAADQEASPATPADATRRRTAVTNGTVPRTKKSDRPVTIDFDGLPDRVHRAGTFLVADEPLCWSPDSKRLLFTASLGGQASLCTVNIPDDVKPKQLVARTGKNLRWLSRENRVFWLSDGVPGSIAATGETVSYPFSAYHDVSARDKYAAAFDLCWRTMRERFYDEALGRSDWSEVRRKYGPFARLAGDTESLAEVICLMLGELKGSHLGFIPHSERMVSASQWRPATGHLGVRFDGEYRGPGCKIREVLPGGPAEKVASRLLAGEVVAAVNGRNVDGPADLAKALTGPPDESVSLTVLDAKAVERRVDLRPISYASARSLLYDAWVRGNQRRVVDASGGKLGYLHIQAMNTSSFNQFVHDLFAVAAGKDGLVIDVRNNGGGSTTDHLLTALTQPVHSVAVSRGGQPGYPQDRKVFATWNKPIVVLCNQNSFSNAESFTHAIKTLKRGPVVGVPTAGGVITTERVEIMDVGRLSIPFRGWFLSSTGEDMEGNGAVPDFVVWPRPEDECCGKDAQLEKAIEVLRGEVEKWQKRSQPKLRKASQRPADKTK